MKQKVKRNKTSSSGNVTRTILREELKEELHNSERRIDQKFDQKFAAFEVKIDFKLEDLELRVDKKAQQYRDQVLTSNDKLAKTLETMREENTIDNFQRDEKIEGHETRIKVLESAQKS